jgi:hypothetical protein
VSMALFVILAGGHAPDVPAWNKALVDARSPAVLAQGIDLSKHTGFLPVTVGGNQTGFYFLLESFPELAAHYPAVAALKIEKPVVSGTAVISMNARQSSIPRLCWLRSSAPLLSNRRAES